MPSGLNCQVAALGGQASQAVGRPSAPIKSSAAGTTGRFGELLIANLQTCRRALHVSLSALSVAALIAFLAAFSSVASFLHHRGAIARNKT